MEEVPETSAVPSSDDVYGDIVPPGPHTVSDSFNGECIAREPDENDVNLVAPFLQPGQTRGERAPRERRFDGKVFPFMGKLLESA